jgi:hypothetical protein
MTVPEELHENRLGLHLFSVQSGVELLPTVPAATAWQKPVEEQV